MPTGDSNKKPDVPAAASAPGPARRSPRVKGAPAMPSLLNVEQRAAIERTAGDGTTRRPSLDSDAGTEANRGAAGAAKRRGGVVGLDPGAIWDPRSERPPADTPWDVPATSFPRGSALELKLAACVRYAVLAPSSHNTQPWKFRVMRDRVVLLADRTRALPVCDPHDRELTISCGCALQHLLLAMRRFGISPRLSLRAVKGEPDALATVVADDSPRHEASLRSDELRLFEAIAIRRTCRHPFADVPLPAGFADAISAAGTAAGHGHVSIALLGDRLSRERVGNLVAEADMVQFADKRFRRELALWMHRNRSRQPDGIPGYAMGMSELASLVAPLVVRTFDMGKGRAAKDEELARHSPLLAVLSTRRDEPKEWLLTGMALANVLLRAAAEGVAASYLNQPCELDLMREKLARLLGGGAGVGGGTLWPQIVLRLGFGPRVAHTPRRPAEDVIVQ
ncbi:MAG: Acg family FMN-binding oxidoreductase [Phycisphaerales bacterium]